MAVVVADFTVVVVAGTTGDSRYSSIVSPIPGSLDDSLNRW